MARPKKIKNGTPEELNLKPEDFPKSGHGNPRSFERPPSDKQRREARKAKANAMPPDIPDNEKYSISGQLKHGMKPYRDFEAERKEAEEDLAARFPAPRLVDLAETNPVLGQVEDDQLRERLQLFLGILLGGGKHKDALAQADFNWNHIQNLRHRYRGLHELWTLCRDIGDEYRQVLRADAAHQRAVEGVEEPVYSQSGKFLGNRTVYSDKLLEMLLKADNPDKFTERRKVEMQGTVINLTTGFDRDTLKEELAEADVTEEGGE